MIRFHQFSIAVLLASWASTTGAQSPYPQSPYASPYAQFAPPSDADQLAQQMRLVAADPTNLYALIAAAGLSLKVGDTDGAAALYTRAEKLSPGNPQIKAGMARLLVNAQRPGEALRLFQEAAQAGAASRDFGSDRALAYDLIGEQVRAQREYRALLRQGADDETTRRYALSLGISGLKDPALALLEPLNRRSDRGAWRVRAFVLAMNGDRAGADRIATTMMPPGMADGLRPFFDRLPRLSATDRAFAVHFGEVRGNATRYADLRRAPALPALSPEPNPFPPVASAQLAAVEVGKKGKKNKKLAPAVQLANRGGSAPLPPPPAPTAVQLAALNASRSTLPPAGYGLAARGPTVLPPPADAYRSRAPQVALKVPSESTRGGSGDDEGDEGPDEPIAAAPAARPISRPTAVAARVPMPIIVTLPPPLVPAQVASNVPVVPPSFALIPAPVVAIATSAASSTPTSDGTVPSVPNVIDPTTDTTPVSTPPVAVAATDPAAATIGTPPPPSGENGDAVLAAIVANIQVPDSELATKPPAPIGEAKLLTVVERKAAAKPDPALLVRDARGRFVDAKGKPLLDARGRPLDAKAAAAWKLAEAKKPDPKLPAKDARGHFVDAKGKPLLDARGRPMDAKAAAAWKIADAKEQAEAKKKPDPAKAEPSRIWVQVAGGANEGTLGKEWSRVTAQSALLKGKAGWTTPLRATNRVLTGPFKSNGEAMALVNQLKKQGIAAFMFTSDAGQKVTRLGAK